MGMFKEKGSDYIDYTLLKKKGILNQTSDVIDFTSQSSPAGASVPVQSSQSSNQPEASNPFGFLDSMASASTSQETSSYYGNESSSQSSSSSNIQDTPIHPEMNSLKIKVEDLEYKIARLLDKLLLIETKLSNFESKIGI